MKKFLSRFVLAMISLVMFGCGSGDFGFGGGTVVTGVASKGPINGAKVAIFSVTSSSSGPIFKQLATATTSSDGTYTANVGSYTGIVFTTMSGSSASYTDESPNTTKTLGVTKLHAVAVIPKSGPFNLAVTPFTELAYQQAASLKPSDITAANTQISNLFLQGASIITTLPINILSTAPAVTDPDKINYSLALAAFSNLIDSNDNGDIAAGVTQLSTKITNNNPTFSNISSVWNPALKSLATNTNIQTGLTTTPVSIAFSSPTYSAVINQSATITAHVTKYDGTGLSGATVAFTASNGTLGTSAPTDSNGNTTVSLTSSAAVGTVITVNASATASGVTVSTKSAAAVTVISDPNTAASVSLASSPASAAVNQSVTLSATVKVVGGGSVTPGSPPNPPATVTFTITSGGTVGSLSAATTTTNASGVATVTLTSSGTSGSVTVTASAGSVTSSPVTVTFTPDPKAPATVAVSASPTSIPADGSTTSAITATVTNFAGTALSGVTVTFTAFGNNITETTAANGTATFNLTSTTTGTATVTASATADSVTKTGSTTVTFTAPPARPTTAIVTLETTGTFTSGTAIGAIDAVVTYPSSKGLTPATTSDGGGVAPAGSSSANISLLVGNVITAGSDTLALTSFNGIPLGTFATVTFTIPASGTLPVTSDFTISSSDASNTSAVSQPNISVTILSVTFQ